MSDVPVAATGTRNRRSTPAPEPEVNPALKVFVMKARDRNEPPFHFSSTAHTILVAAEDEAQARRVAQNYGPHWAEGLTVTSGEEPRESLTTCEELKLYQPGVIGVTE